MATRKTPQSKANPQDLDKFNQQLRSSEIWNEFVAGKGFAPGQSIRLSDRDRKEFQKLLESRGLTFEKGMEIDPAGNINQDEGAWKQIKKYGPYAAGGAAAMFGVPGLFPGLLTGGGAGAAAGGANLGGLYGGPATGAMTSQGVSQGVGMASGGGSGLGSILGALGGGVAKEKGIGGKLIDALINPSTIMAGIGAGLTAFGDDEIEDPRLDPERVAHQDKIRDTLYRLVAARASEPKTFRAIPDIKFSPNIPGLPFDIGSMFQGQGRPEFTRQPNPGTKSVLDDLAKFAGQQRPEEEIF